MTPLPLAPNLVEHFYRGGPKIAALPPPEGGSCRVPARFDAWQVRGSLRLVLARPGGSG